MAKIVLASGSPRRQELLRRMGITDFTVRVPEVEEYFPAGLTPEETVAFVNADNDIDMIQMAGIGVAVADATESCRKAADRCTGASYESGVAQALRELLS